MSIGFPTSVIDALDAHIAILDENGVILGVNRAWREFAEQNGAGLPSVSDGVNYLDICDAAAGPDAVQAHAFANGIRAVINKECENFAHEYSCDSPRERRWYRGRITRFDVDGRMRILAAHENITERKKNEEDALGSKGHFASIFMSSPISIAITRLANDQVIDVNNEWEKLTGYAREETVGRTPDELNLWFDPHERIRLVAMIQEHLPVQGVEVRLRRRLGNIAVVLFSAVTIELEGEPCMLSMALDVSYNKSVERELKQTNERYRELFENSGTGILILDDRGTYLMANERAAAFFGKTPEELIGKSMSELFAPAGAQRYLERNRLLLESGGHQEYEDRFMGPEGERRFLIIDQCLKDEAGKNVAIQSISLDITERRQAEEELVKNGQRLHALSQRLLDVQETERKHIAYELHDEIGQILTAVKLNLHGIQQFENVEDIPKKINESLVLIDHSLQQVRDLAVDLHPWMLDQLGLIPSLRWHIDHHAQRSKLNMQFSTGNIDQRFPVDIEIACFRVVQEALTNIIRHAQATEVIVSLTMEHDALSVEVSDNGIGFDVDTITVEPGSARGFGLLSMEERVILLGGTFEISSIVNKGTTIRFRLPLARTTALPTINDNR